jgi:tetratricopeptide (TPR) repeat protein
LLYYQLGFRLQASQFLTGALAAALASHEPIEIEKARNCMILVGADTDTSEQAKGIELDSIGTRKGYFSMAARELLRAGNNYLRLSHFSAALVSLRSAQMLFERFSDADGIAETLSLLGRAYLELGRPDLAVGLLDRAASLLYAYSRPAIEIGIRWNQGSAHLALASGPGEHREKASKAFERMRFLAGSVADSSGTADALAAQAAWTRGSRAAGPPCFNSYVRAKPRVTLRPRRRLACLIV